MNLEYLRARLMELVGGDSVWILEGFVVVFVALLIDFAQRLFVRRLARKATDTRNLWDDAVVGAIRGPLSLLIWVIGITLAGQIVGARTESPIFEIMAPIRSLGVVIAFTWFLLRLIKGVQDGLLERPGEGGQNIDRSTAEAIGKLTRASIVITAVLVAMQTLGLSISGVLAFGGIGGIAVGFAAKDLLANFFGGLTVYLDRPFAVGDWVYSPDRQIEGTITEIGWRRTVIQTFDKRPQYVPNSVFLSIAVVNPSRMTHRRIYETIGVRYQDVAQVPEILEDLRRMLGEHPDIDQSQTLMVNFDAFAESSLDFFVYCFTRTTVWTTYHEVKEAVLLEIASIIEGHGAEMAFPTRTIHVRDALALARPPHAVEQEAAAS